MATFCINLNGADVAFRVVSTSTHSQFGWVEEHHVVEPVEPSVQLGRETAVLAGERTQKEDGAFSVWLAPPRGESWSFWTDERGMLTRARLTRCTVPPKCSRCGRTNTRAELYKYCLNCMCAIMPCQLKTAGFVGTDWTPVFKSGK